MNPQPTYWIPDARIGQVLDALGDTEAPAGLEARIAARLAQATEVRAKAPAYLRIAQSFRAAARHAARSASFLPAQAKLFALTATALTLIATFAIAHLRTRQMPQGSSLDAHASRPSAAISNPVLSATHRPANIFASVNAGVGSSTGSHSETSEPRRAQPARFTVPSTQAIAQPLQPSDQDPDQIALAETLAPSRPAAPMPLTRQELTVIAAARPGQPVELAGLDLDRGPDLRPHAEALHNAEVNRYLKSLLAPFALADALQPTTFSHPQEAFAAPPADLTSNSN